MCFNCVLMLRRSWSNGSCYNWFLTMKNQKKKCSIKVLQPLAHSKSCSQTFMHQFLTFPMNRIYKDNCYSLIQVFSLSSVFTLCLLLFCLLTVFYSLTFPSTLPWQMAAISHHPPLPEFCLPPFPRASSGTEDPSTKPPTSRRTKKYFILHLWLMGTSFFQLTTVMIALVTLCTRAPLQRAFEEPLHGP